MKAKSNMDADTPKGRFFVGNALREALGFVVADLRREWRRELELMRSEAHSEVDRLRAENVALRAEVAALKGGKND